MPDVLGLVPLVGREPLACWPYNGQALFLLAVEALRQVANPPVMVLADGLQQAAVREALAGYRVVVDLAECPREDDRLRAAVETSDVVVVHDPLCPLVSAVSLREMIRVWQPGTALVAVRPVVDTVKAASDGIVAGTVDRDTLRIVSSPVVLPASILLDVPDLVATLTDLSTLVQWLRGRCDVVLAGAPSASRRIEDVSSIQLVMSLDAVGHRLRER
jgi:2-C-methyl-D-erythritol 4-phosphate cytidylyltransferase